MPELQKNKTKYGYFSEDGKEYILTRPDPPRPWYNYLGHQDYGVRFSQNGGGFSRYRPPDGNLINPLGSFDRPGKYIYIRDNDTKKFWTTNWAPVQADHDFFQCRHGLDYSEITSLNFGVRSIFHLFVPPDDPLEIWTITLENCSAKKRRLSIFPFMELYLAGYTAAYDLPIYSSWADYQPKKKLILGEYVHLHTAARFEYFICPLFEPDGYDCRREDFIGVYNDYSNPRAVLENNSKNHKGYHDPLVAAFKKEVVLEAGETKMFQLLAGVSEDSAKQQEIITRYSTPQKINVALEKLRRNWDERLNQAIVHTPDEGINLYANVWLKNVIDKCVTWIRGPTSNSNFGFRDVMQDAKGVVKFDAARTRSAILRAMPYQFSDGSALRQWAADPAFHDRRKFADSSLWIAFAVCAYIRETGDQGILDVVRPYQDKGEATVYEHLLAGLRKISNDRGAHGIPLIWEGDWNDGLGKMGEKGKGESIWLAMAVIAANKETSELAAFLSDKKVETELNEYNSQITAAINSHGWDGQWYRRGFTDAGRPVGTAADDEVALWLNTQTWAILSGVSDPERTRQIRDVVEKRLKTEMGYMLFDPPFKRFRPDIGYYSNLIPKQWNYVHSNAFKFAAECEGGFGDAAYKTLSLILPVNHDPDKTRAEPYTIPNYYVTDDPERMGRSLFGWFTATCSWVFTAIIEGMMGIKPGYDGLTIRPCFPREWKEASAEVNLRGARYLLTVRNLDGRETGVRKLLLDGREIPANEKIPYSPAGVTRRIEAYL
ncbi:MAG: hypothetical protein V1899_07040 [Planctomycetota bacterium]